MTEPETSARGLWEVQTRDSLHHLDLRDLDAPLWRRVPQRKPPTASMTHGRYDGDWVEVFSIRAIPSREAHPNGQFRDGLPEPGDHLILEAAVGRVGTSVVRAIRRIKFEEAQEIRPL